MIDDEIDTTWLMEAARSHQEAMLQVQSLPSDLRATFAANLARQELVFRSQAYSELCDLIAAHERDRCRYREGSTGMSAQRRLELKTSLNADVGLIASKLEAFRSLLGAAGALPPVGVTQLPPIRSQTAPGRPR